MRGLPGYRVQVKRKGKFVFIGGLVPKSEALKIGSRFAMRTSARTFKLVPTKQFVMFPKTKGPDLSQFRPAIRKGKPVRGLFVEKTRFAIDMPGEFKEITLKGLKARKGFRLL